MKKITLLRIVFFQLIIMSLISCEADLDSDFEVLAYEEPILIDSANYFPSDVGNTWEYVNAQGISEMLEVKNQTEINGELFYEINQFDGKYAAVRKNNSEYELRLQGDPVGISGYDIESTYYKFFLFDHNAAVGEKWETKKKYTVSFNPKTDQPVRPSKDYDVVVKSELLERNQKLKIKGTIYEDVIKIRLSITAAGKTTVSTYCLANNIGIVKYSEGVNSVQLQKYSVKY